MTIDPRGQRAGHGMRRAIDDLNAADPGRGSYERFERRRIRKRRNERIGAGVLAGVLTIAAVVFVTRSFTTDDRDRPATLTATGRILYGSWDPTVQRADWRTVRVDGSGGRDLGISATCAVWYPDGAHILITNDQAVGQGSPLRPAVVDPDGSHLRRLDGTRNPDLNLGCGDVSPDGSRIALEGFGGGDHPELDGIYSIRASDGGDLTTLVRGHVSPPMYSPDGRLLSFFETRAGVSPSGSGALFVTRSHGSAHPHRITPWGAAFDDHAWSPDGAWIIFQRPYGQLYLVRPDGSDLHRIPVNLPRGAGALNPSWSPDGAWLVFSMQREDEASIYIVRPDGTRMHEVIALPGQQLQHADWASTAP
jgi:Tol biopolymer transport system component